MQNTPCMMRLIAFILFLAPFLFACSGEVSGAKNPLSSVPNESVAAELEGTWNLSAVITESDCPEIGIGEHLDQNPFLKVREGECVLEDSSALEMGVETVCEAGGNTIGVRGTLDMSSGECHISGQENTLLHYNEETKLLEGEIELIRAFSGNCPEEIKAEFKNGCHMRANVEGSIIVGFTQEPPSEEPLPPEEPLLPLAPLEEPVASEPETRVTETQTEETNTEAIPEEESSSERDSGPTFWVRPVAGQQMHRFCGDSVCKEGQICFMGRMCIPRNIFLNR